RDCEGADQVHEGRCDGAGTNPAHIFAQEASRGFAELANLKIFHAECLDDTISCGGLLQDLCDVAETELAVLGGAANLAAEFVDRPYDQRKKNACRQRHFPIDDQKNEDEDEKGQPLLEEIDEKLAESRARTIHVVDGYREDFAGRIVAEETHWLAQDF